MKYLLIFLYLMGAAPAIARGARTVYPNTKFQRYGQVIELKMDIDATSRNAPLEELAAAQKHYPAVSQFKISWIAVVGGGNYKGTALYNRAQQTVNLYAYETFEEKIIRYHRLYFFVSPPILAQVAQRHKTETVDDNGPSAFGFFDDLTKYGCRQHKFDAN